MVPVAKSVVSFCSLRNDLCVLILARAGVGIYPAAAMLTHDCCPNVDTLPTCRLIQHHPHVSSACYSLLEHRWLYHTRARGASHCSRCSFAYADSYSPPAPRRDTAVLAQARFFPSPTSIPSGSVCQLAASALSFHRSLCCFSETFLSAAHCCSPCTPSIAVAGDAAAADQAASFSGILFAVFHVSLGTFALMFVAVAAEPKPPGTRG
jgi:hypothetical protein